MQQNLLKISFRTFYSNGKKQIIFKSNRQKIFIKGFIFKKSPLLMRPSEFVQLPERIPQQLGYAENPKKVQKNKKEKKGCKQNKTENRFRLLKNTSIQFRKNKNKCLHFR